MSSIKEVHDSSSIICVNDHFSHTHDFHAWPVVDDKILVMPMIQDDHLPRTSNMRVARSAAEIERIKIKNRRKRYLDLHPEYFGPDLELAGMMA